MEKQHTKQFRIVIATLSMVAMLSACAEDEITSSNPTQQENQIAQIESGVLAFNSTDDLARQIKSLQETDSYDITSISATRAGNTEFISLRDKLISGVLDGFSPEEIREIEAEGLVYDPEDELIIDPYLMSVLNADREVMVGGKMYRYVKDGLVEYVPTVENIDAVNRLAVSDFAARGIKLTPIEYKQWEEVVQGESTQPVTRANTGITLKDGLNIPAYNCAVVEYAKGNGSGSWLQKTASGIFGTNVTIDNHFDKKHRMKLRMYEQEYILYRAIGMTIRMQRRRLGIWWRIKAQEFRYGWTAIEVNYEWKTPPFKRLDPPTSQFPATYEVPALMSKKFPFANDNIVLFRIANYDVTTGNINSVFASGIKAVAKQIQGLIASDSSYANKPKGLFCPHSDYKKIAVIFPPEEHVAYNDGREVVRWDMTWFSGNFTMGYSNDLSGWRNWSYKNTSFSSAVNTDIARGTVVGAAKYNGQWKACVILSK